MLIYTHGKKESVDHNSFACCLSRFVERCDVIATHYFMKVKCFSFCTLPKNEPVVNAFQVVSFTRNKRHFQPSVE